MKKPSNFKCHIIIFSMMVTALLIMIAIFMFHNDSDKSILLALVGVLGAIMSAFGIYVTSHHWLKTKYSKDENKKD